MAKRLGTQAAGVVGVLIAASLAVGVGGSALADVTVDFEQDPPGTVVTDQYANQGGAGQGVVFGPLPAGAGVGDGLRPVIRTPPAGQTQSGSQVADIATCVGCEFFTPRTTGTLSVPRSRVSVYVGYLGEPAICTAIDPNAVGCAVVRLRAFNATGGQVAESSVQVTRGAGIRSLLSVSTPSATIVGFEISGRAAIDDSKPIAIDDLILGTPDPAQAPDFTLNPSTADVIVEQGKEVTVPIAIGRLNGSSGDIALRAEGLPQGVVAAFAPNPAQAAQTVLTLTARADAPRARRPISITGTPQSASAGPAPRSFAVDLTVQPACPQVGTADELIAELMKGHKCVYVKDTAQIDLADVPNNPLSDGDSVLVVPEGVTLMGGRSPTRAGGMLELSRRSKAIMLRLGSNTRVTGLRLRGYNQRDPKDRDDPTRGIQINGGSGVLIDNNEIFGWPAEGVEAIDTPADLQTTPRITRNFIHNNVQCNLGYGVVLSGSGFARIDRNVFNYNRHDIAGSGEPGQGYLAELNLVLTSGPTCGGNYNQHFDMHGTDGGTGGTAGRLIEIRRNTIRGAQRYGFNGRLVRPAFDLRGTPQNQAVFAENAVAHGSALNQHTTVLGKTVSSSGAVRVEGASAFSLLRKNKLVIGTTARASTQLASWRSATSTATSVPMSSRPWEQCGSTLPPGSVSGSSSTTPISASPGSVLATSTVTVRRTSSPRTAPAGWSLPVARAHRHRFPPARASTSSATGSETSTATTRRTSSGRAAPASSSRAPVRLGGSRWPRRAWRSSICASATSTATGRPTSSALRTTSGPSPDGGNSGWRRLNKTLSSNLGSLVFADFNGDRRTDVARSSGGNWQVSWGGATAWQTLQLRRSESLATGMLFGDFTGDGRADVLRHAAIGGTSLFCGAIASFERFRLSAGGTRPLARWSSADMR